MVISFIQLSNNYSLSALYIMKKKKKDQVPNP